MNNINNDKRMTKLETQIYRAKKWLGVQLVDNGSKNLLVDASNSSLEGVYILIGKPRKYQDKYIINGTNFHKSIFSKQFACINSAYWDNNVKRFIDYIIFKPYFEDDKEMCARVAKGADGLFDFASYLMTNPQFRVRKW